MLARRRLSSPLVWRRLPILPIWLGQPRSDLHAQKRMCQPCLGTWVRRYRLPHLYLAR